MQSSLYTGGPRNKKVKKGKCIHFHGEIYVSESGRKEYYTESIDPLCINCDLARVIVYGVNDVSWRTVPYAGVVPSNARHYAV